MCSVISLIKSDSALHYNVAIVGALSSLIEIFLIISINNFSSPVPTHCSNAVIKIVQHIRV